MSSVSSIGGGTSLAQLLQQLGLQNQSSATTSSFTPALNGSQDSDGDSDGSGSSGAVSGSHHGGHHGVASKLEAAITSALNSSSTSGTDSTDGTPGGASDPNSIIQNAINQFFSTSSQDAANGGTAGATAPGTPTDPASQQAAFSQLLNSQGVNAGQFQQDFQSALQNSSANGGNVDFATLFQNFPPGSVVNVLA